MSEEMKVGRKLIITVGAATFCATLLGSRDLQTASTLAAIMTGLAIALVFVGRMVLADEPLGHAAGRALGEVVVLAALYIGTVAPYGVLWGLLLLTGYLVVPPLVRAVGHVRRRQTATLTRP